MSYNDEKRKKEKNNHKNNSSKQLNKYFDNEIKLTMNDVKQVERLNISY